MTDMMSEAFGRELVAQTEFNKQGVWLPLLAMHSLNAGEGVVRGKTFTECVIEGPAVVAAMVGTTFDGCNMGLAEDVNSLLFQPRGPKLIGVIGLQDCRFVRCRFVQVGFTGSPEFLTELSETLQSARKASGQ
ncbi:hypothetical protein [uncultured Brevundimonas sp.]|uniref:hypothetical protein n=1 Tax=uncultured Brevundimonas sp. TaxID=213418 RepID=UPI0025F9204A|nr:hypothetical protein [uncultured Brevundimonas sp.]